MCAYICVWSSSSHSRQSSMSSIKHGHGFFPLIQKKNLADDEDCCVCVCVIRHIRTTTLIGCNKFFYFSSIDSIQKKNHKKKKFVSFTIIIILVINISYHHHHNNKNHINLTIRRNIYHIHPFIHSSVCLSFIVIMYRDFSF